MMKELVEGSDTMNNMISWLAAFMEENKCIRSLQQSTSTKFSLWSCYFLRINDSFHFCLNSPSRSQLSIIWKILRQESSTQRESPYEFWASLTVRRSNATTTYHSKIGFVSLCNTSLIPGMLKLFSSFFCLNISFLRRHHPAMFTG